MFDQAEEINILHDAVVSRAEAFFIEPFGLSQMEPVGSLIGDAFEATLIDEGLEQVKGVAKIGGPCLAEVSDIEGDESFSRGELKVRGASFSNGEGLG
jgi:hypothetical protein